MFYCDKSIFDKIIEIMKINHVGYFVNNMYDTNEVNRYRSPCHALERLFGLV